MKKKTLLFLSLLPAFSQAQQIVDAWMFNSGGQTASYWQNDAAPGNPPSYSYHTTSDLADVLKVCYDTDSVWVSSNGMTFSMGQYQNPGSCIAQDYVFRFPLTPTVGVNKAISPKTGAIGVLLNGIPVYGLSNANSWDNATSSNLPGMGGDGIWNVEVYLSEGFVLDTAFGAHPQQQGAYHSHATPWRLYESVSTTQHSPIVGYAFDGFPIYGPYGFSDPEDANGGVSRMQTGYSLRNISQRHTLPDGTVLSAAQYGPNVSATYPIGFYCEDYEWLQSNGGDLDEYNGRFCVTPEYPTGTYAYFVTMDAAGTPEFPYYIGIEYYGVPDSGNFPMGASASGIQFPASGTSCLTADVSEADLSESFALYPNPVVSDLSVNCSDEWNGTYTLTVRTLGGETIYAGEGSGTMTVQLGNIAAPGMYLVTIASGENQFTSRIVLQ